MDQHRLPAVPVAHELNELVDVVASRRRGIEPPFDDVVHLEPKVALGRYGFRRCRPEVAVDGAYEMARTGPLDHSGDVSERADVDDGRL
jgi:hypothetical protein